jgi:hypothetical protein
MASIYRINIIVHSTHIHNHIHECSTYIHNQYACIWHPYAQSTLLCIWVLYTCIYMVYIGGIYMYVHVVYECLVHVYWLCIWVLCTCILIVYMAVMYIYILIMYMGWVLCASMLIVHMGAIYMHIDCVYRCYIHVYDCVARGIHIQHEHTCIYHQYTPYIYMYIAPICTINIHVYSTHIHNKYTCI